MADTFSRRGFLGLAAGGVAAAALTACGGSSSGGASDGKSLTFRWWGGDERNKAYQDALKVFTKKTGITVNAQFSSYDGYFDKLNTEFAGGNPPDIFQMDTALVSTYAAKGVLTDLGTYVPGTIKLDTLYPALRTGGVVSGKNYGIASGSGYSPMLYNKTVLDKLGITAPADEWTWDDYTALTNEISKKWGKGRYGAIDSSPDDSGALRPWLRQRGKDLYLDSGALGYDAKDLTDWFTYWEGLRKSGAICPPSMLTNAGTAGATHPLIAGKVAITSGWQLAQMQALTKDELKLIIVPRDVATKKTGQAMNAGVLLSIPVKSKNAEGAAKLIDFFANDDDAIKIMGLRRGNPPSDKALDLLKPGIDPTAKADVDYGQYVAKEVAKDALPAPANAPAGYGDVKTALDDAAKKVAFGKQSVDEAVKGFFSTAQAALDKAK